MKIENLNIEARGNWTAVTGFLQWEDSDRPSREIFFSTPSEFATDLSTMGNPFLAGCFLPALRHGEQRLRVDGPCCPWLRDGLETVMAYFNQWFHGEPRSLQLEHRGQASIECHSRRTAMFLSGGVDSLFALYDNHQRYSPDHPGRIQDAVVLQGFEIRVDQETSEPAFDNALASLRLLADEASVHLIPMVTNLRQLDPDGDFWGEQFQGGILAAAAHALAPRFTDIVLAASTDIANIKKYGTHPAVDPNLSSYSLSIHHQGERFTRVEKLRRLAAWRSAIDNLRVCSKAPAKHLNCGECEKCIRVMLELTVIGKLRTSASFQAKDVTPSMMRGLTIGHDAMVFYPELLHELRQIGRHDLALPLASILIRDLPFRIQSHAEEVIKDLDHAFNRDRLRARIRKWRETLPR